MPEAEKTNNYSNVLADYFCASKTVEPVARRTYITVGPITKKNGQSNKIYYFLTPIITVTPFCKRKCQMKKKNS